MSCFASAPALLMLAAIGGLCACSSDACQRSGQEPQIYEEGRTTSDETFYETSGFDGTFLFFPSGRTYKLPHGLRSTPTDVGIYLAFVPNPREAGSLIAPSAGNQGGIQAVDDRFVTVRNDSCAEFFVRVTATAAGSPDSALNGPAADAGADEESN